MPSRSSHAIPATPAALMRLWKCDCVAYMHGRERAPRSKRRCEESGDFACRIRPLPMTWWPLIECAYALHNRQFHIWFDQNCIFIEVNVFPVFIAKPIGRNRKARQIEIKNKWWWLLSSSRRVKNAPAVRLANSIVIFHFMIYWFDR